MTQELIKISVNWIIIQCIYVLTLHIANACLALLYILLHNCNICEGSDHVAVDSNDSSVIMYSPFQLPKQPGTEAFVKMGKYLDEVTLLTSLHLGLQKGHSCPATVNT